MDGVAEKRIQQRETLVSGHVHAMGIMADGRTLRINAIGYR